MQESSTQNFHVFQKPKSSWVQKRFGFSNTGMHLCVPHINHGLNNSQGSSRAGLAVSLLPSAVWWFAFVVWIVLDIPPISLHWLSYVLYSIVLYLCNIVMMYFKLIYSSFDEGLVLYIPNSPGPKHPKTMVSGGWTCTWTPSTLEVQLLTPRSSTWIPEQIAQSTYKSLQQSRGFKVVLQILYSFNL